MLRHDALQDLAFPDRIVDIEPFSRLDLGDLAAGIHALVKKIYDLLIQCIDLCSCILDFHVFCILSFLFNGFPSAPDRRNEPLETLYSYRLLVIN